MALFVVIRQRGSGWDWSQPMRAQRDWPAHAAFMDALETKGFIRLGGPRGDEDSARRVLHVVEAADAQEVAAALARDPWSKTELLATVSVEPWTILLRSSPQDL